MRFVIILVLVIASGFTGYGQISFLKYYATDSFDKGEGATQLADSSYLLTGSSSSFSGSAQAFIMKIDSTGKFLWSRSYGGVETDKGRRIFQVENDGIYVLGQSNSIGSNFYDIYFFKTDETGILLFEKTFGGTDYEDIHDAVMLKDTSFVLVGETYSNGGGQQDIYLARISKNGDLLWTQSMGNSAGADKAESVVLYQDTLLYVAGNEFVVDSSKNKAFIRKMNVDGTVYWTKYYGDEGQSAFRDLHIYKDTIRAVGYFTQNGSDIHNFFRAMIRPDGSLEYGIKEYHTATYEINQVERYSDNNYVLSMSVKDEPAIPTKPIGFDNMYYLFNGNLLFGGYFINVSKNNDDIVNQMIRTSDGGVLSVGYVSEDNLVQVQVMKIDGRDYFGNISLPASEAEIVGLEEQFTVEELKFYPNPVSDELIIASKYAIQKIRIYSVSQQLVHEQKLSGTTEWLSLAHLAPGHYTAFIETAQGTVRKSLIRLD